MIEKLKKYFYSEKVRKEVIGTLIAILIALVIRSFIIQAFNVPTGSMIPTLKIGDYIFVTKYSYGYSKHALPFSIPVISGVILKTEPERGDVIVFRTPEDNDTYYIKRLIGIPGDVVELRNNILYVNSIRITGKVKGTDGNFNIVDENLYGVKYEIQVLKNGIGGASNYSQVKVPEGSLFVMGDNRDASADSRYWGFLPRENVIGKARYVLFSIDAPYWQIWMWPFKIRNRFFVPLG